MTPDRYRTIRRVLDRRQPDLTLITDEVHKGRNLSALVRTCDAVGIDTIHCVIPKAGYRPYRGTALGSHKWVHTALHEQVDAPVAQLREQGFTIVAAHLSPRARDYRDLDYTRPTALLLGTEKCGVSAAALAAADREVVIPMMGMVASYNVSVAAAIILAEVQRQRQSAGLYDRCRLPEATYRQRLFQWCQPAVTAFCERRGLAYPPLDETGEIVDAPHWYRRVRETVGD
ncbi:tRNA (guanosine(18)-2'-O)-methyltransferase TrmH [Exilibacterium tricleocarpae]|uniref:tRNA (guanosine(18)-2'-O)-methyltransferase n=1 Tax=Exilibacterium tricleocarpae TaxID=2591008 RepID=A0A545TVM3_9GAMM|nr:tRNA (guanosine(18)-2'-O)-methyltransferase TrmH [Exilibacterium tricleocarpae]TQV81277.1 tRNA (guanosine(18)-2'-O)-methyltransferase TrmH [Exilibacterium tricleocarpae]